MNSSTRTVPAVSLCCAATLALLAGCPGPEMNPDCRVGADCASGVCRGDGTCAPVSDGGSGGGAGSSGGGSSGSGGGSGGGSSSGGGSGGGSAGGGTGGDGGTDGGMPVGCQFRNDGVIDGNEVFFGPNLRATYVISKQTAFSTVGTTNADGGAQWDFTTALTGDVGTLVETKPLTGQWFASTFPNGGYTTVLDDAAGLLAIFSFDTTGLYLQGVASRDSGTSQTKVTYSPWIKVLQFPLKAGDTWTTTSTADGEYEGKTIGTFATLGVFGLPFQQEVYTSRVDASGSALTPYSTFNVLRVSTTRVQQNRIYTLSPWTDYKTSRQFTWNSECFGTVATVNSVDGADTTEITTAAEVRRLSK